MRYRAGELARLVTVRIRVYLALRTQVSLTAECDLWLVAGEGEAEFKITLSWGKGD